MEYVLLLHFINSREYQLDDLNCFVNILSIRNSFFLFFSHYFVFKFSCFKNLDMHFYLFYQIHLATADLTETTLFLREKIYFEN